MKLIDKAVLVAEIKKIREHVKRLRYAVDANCIVTVRNACECLESSIDLLSNSINTLEAKEVDLEKECYKYFEENDLCVHDDYIKFASHFFELGLKAQKGE